jgi:pimeloyl-ACP methyl ester carboxylesterase
LKYVTIIGLGLLAVLICASLFLAWSFSVKGLPEGVLDSGDSVKVVATAYGFSVDPDPDTSGSGLIFLTGAFVGPSAYLPLARSLAKEGHPVRLVGLPWGVAPFADQHDELFNTIDTLQTEERPWVLGGHSRGAAFAEEYVSTVESAVAGLFLVGATYPREDDLSGLTIPVTKVYASNDGVAKPTDVLAYKGQLPPEAQFVEIAGGNHAQFGYYGPQLFDGTATISREDQQAQTSAAALALLRNVDTAAWQSDAASNMNQFRLDAARFAFQFAVPARSSGLMPWASRQES